MAEANNCEIAEEMLGNKSDEFTVPQSQSSKGRKRTRDSASKEAGEEDEAPMDTLSAKSRRPNLPRIAGENLMVF